MPVFTSIRESLKRRQEERAKKREEDLRAELLRQEQAAQRARMDAENERHIASIRVITGEVKYQYVVIDTLRVFAHYVAEPGASYDPTAATTRATRLMQELAHSAGADAVIHAQYQILRYTTRRAQYAEVPVYEAHLFGTAIKIMGPPQDWPKGEGD
ncbi:MAG TPA: hypothetical protein VHB73_04910 [Alphaproteobacteria bacterium]|nr:hypothetical protein [Alphaproteobacteria bacterium]